MALRPPCGGALQPRTAPGRGLCRRRPAAGGARQPESDRARRTGRPLPHRDPGGRGRMGRNSGPHDVQRLSHRVPGIPDPDDRVAELDGRQAREVLSREARRLSRDQLVRGAAAGAAHPLARRLPPVPVGRRAGRIALRGGGLHPQKPLRGVGVLPLALHERRLSVERYGRDAPPHGFPGPSPDGSDRRGRCAGAGVRLALHERPQRRQPGRDGPCGRSRPRGKPDDRAVQPRQLLPHRAGADPLPAPGRSQRRLPIPAPIRDRLPHPLAPMARGFRLRLSGRRHRRPGQAAQPLRRPARRAAVRPAVPGRRLRPHRWNPVPGHMQRRRDAGAADRRLFDPLGAGHDTRSGGNPRPGAPIQAGSDDPVCRLSGRLGAL